MKIQDIMNSRVESISPDATAKEAARKMHDLHIGALTVLDAGQLVGIITDRDICVKVTATGHDAVMTKVGEVMTKEVNICYEDQDVDDAAGLMMDKRIRRLAILSRDNQVSGFLSVDDLAKTSFDLAGTVLESSAPLH